MPDDRLRVPEPIAESIRAHGCETYPHECCGAMFGGDGDVTDILPLPNTTEEGPRRRFLVRPSDYRQAEARATGLGRELLGFYHSHPDAPAKPSQYDLDHAWPSFFYVIVAIADGRPAAMTGWRLGADRSRFEPVAVDTPAAVAADGSPDVRMRPRG